MASSETLFRAEASDLDFDGIELADEPYTLFGNRAHARRKLVDIIRAATAPIDAGA